MKDTIFNFESEIRDKLVENQNILNIILKENLSEINKIINVLISAIMNDRCIYWIGNGGSASEAQHLSSELVNKMYINRKSIKSLALLNNDSLLTSISNDSDFRFVFKRQIEAFVKKEDVLIALSTSGRSENVIAALKKAKNLKAINIVFTGNFIKKIENISDYIICVPSKDTPMIQECHLIIGHIICGLVEKKLFGN